jgi:hypothetical protein
MRGIDFRLSINVKDCWLGKIPAEGAVCPLLADLDRFLIYLDDEGVKPGHAVDCCPECGDEHRWALLKALMSLILEIFPDRKSALLNTVDQNNAAVYALYGGKEKYLEMRKAAAEYFAKVGADNSYTL